MSALTFLIVAVIKIAVTLGVLLTVVAYTVWLERKVVGRMQNRWGPSRVGPFGLLQPLADGIKFLLQGRSDAALRREATSIFSRRAWRSSWLSPRLPWFPSVPSFTCSASAPRCRSPAWWTSSGHASDINVGILVILGITSLGVYGIALAGWSSNSKYSLLGSLRASAQMVSYEVSLGLSLVGVLLMSSTLSLAALSTHSSAPGSDSFRSGTSSRASSSPSSFT